MWEVIYNFIISKVQNKFERTRVRKARNELKGVER